MAVGIAVVGTKTGEGIGVSEGNGSVGRGAAVPEAVGKSVFMGTVVGVSEGSKPLVGLARSVSVALARGVPEEVGNSVSVGTRVALSVGTSVFVGTRVEEIGRAHV